MDRRRSRDLRGLELGREEERAATSRSQAPAPSTLSTCCRAASRRRPATRTRSSSARAPERSPTRPTARRSSATLARVARLPHVTERRQPVRRRRHAISRDGTIAFATVSFDERANALPKAAVDRVITTAESARSANLQVELGGQAIEQAQQASLGFATRRRHRRGDPDPVDQLRVVRRDGAADRARRCSGSGPGSE